MVYSRLQVPNVATCYTPDRAKTPVPVQDGRIRHAIGRPLDNVQAHGTRGTAPKWPPVLAQGNPMNNEKLYRKGPEDAEIRKGSLKGNGHGESVGPIH